MNIKFKLWLIIFLAFQIHCAGSNLREENKSITEFRVLKSSEFEIMKKFGSKYYVSAFYGKQKDILDLVSVRNTTISQTDVQKEISKFNDENLFYLELITSEDIDEEITGYSFQSKNQSINNYALFSENLVLYNNRSMEYKNASDKQILLSARRMIPLSRRVFKSEDLFSYVFLLPLKEINTIKLFIDGESKIEFLQNISR
jgi:hypothetical protein